MFSTHRNASCFIYRVYCSPLRYGHNYKTLHLTARSFLCDLFFSCQALFRIVNSIVRDLVVLWPGSVVGCIQIACHMYRGQGYNDCSVSVMQVLVLTWGIVVALQGHNFSLVPSSKGERQVIFQLAVQCGGYACQARYKHWKYVPNPKIRLEVSQVREML